MDPSILDLFGGNDATAGASAAALAQAIRQRKAAATLGAITADPGMGAVAKQLGGDADAMQQGLLGAAQHRAGLDVQRQHFADQAAFRNQLLGVRQQDANTRAEAVAQRPALIAAKGAAAGGHGGHGAPAGGFDPEAIADGIVAGRISPVISGMPREKGAVLSALAKRGFDHATAESDWHATQKHISSLNSTQQERLRQSIQFADHQLGNIEKLYAEWQAVAPNFGFRGLNRVTLAAAKAKGGEAGAVAQALEGQINDLVGDIGNIYMGGNSPTDHALALAKENLSGSWDEPTFKKSVDLIRQTIRLRHNAMLNSPIAGASAGNKYGPKPAEPASAPTLSAQDQQAKAWADANPNDPRAAKILERLKAKGL